MNEKSQQSADEDQTDSVKEISVMPIVTNLFRPTAIMLGNEIRDYLKGIIDDWKERKHAENVLGHIEIATKKVKEQNPDAQYKIDTIKQLDLFEEWTKGAQEIDPNDSVIAELWQNLLIELADHNISDNLIIKKLKAINAKEAQLLLLIYSQRNEGYEPKGGEVKRITTLRISLVRN
ncbi:MAG: hypothetical protein AMJ53_06150 [Gammaproteobacteria bacterium SG8_11]|nr:MAG: hypothetical protein AMJ53_06150 [Gammaproteobacteria bacterium SG8_11]